MGGEFPTIEVFKGHSIGGGGSVSEVNLQLLARGIKRVRKNMCCRFMDPIVIIFGTWVQSSREKLGLFSAVDKESTQG